MYFRKWASNQSKWVALKNRKHCLSAKSTHVELWSQIWTDICCTLYFLNDNSWVELPLVYLTIFLPFDHKRYFEAQTAALEGLHAIICLMQTGIFWWNGVAVFFIKEKNGSTKAFSAYANTSWYLSHFITDRRRLFHLVINNALRRTNDNYTQRFPRNNFFHTNQHLKYHTFS